MFLRIQHVVLDSPQPEHAAQQLGCFHIGRAHQHRPSGFHQFRDLLDHGVILGFLGLVNQVVLVVADNGTVGRDDHHIQFINGPELACFRFSRTGHTGQLVIHPEVVLQGDGREGLRRVLDLDVFLGFHRLVQTVAPAASLHDTARLLVHNLHLAVHDDVVHVFLEHRVGLQELDHDVHAVALQGVIFHQRVFPLLFLGRIGHRSFDFGDLAAHIGKHEEIGIVHAGGQHLVALVGHIHRMLLLVDHEIQLVRDDGHFPLVVLDIDAFGLLKQLLHARLAEELDEGLVFGKALVAAEEELAAFGLVAGGNQLLRFIQGGVHQLTLHAVEFFHIGTELDVLLVGGRFFNGAGNDERGPRIVDEHGVHLVHNGEMVLALYQVGRADGHVVAQVVETEFVVGTERDVTVIGLAAFVAVGLMLVDTVHAQAMEHVQRSHPFRVSFGQVVVYRHHVHALSGQGVQEHRQRSHEGLSFTGGHLRDFSFVQDDTADELHIVMHHIPRNLVSAGHPMVAPDCFVSVDGDEVLSGGGQGAVEIRGGHLDKLLLRKTAGGGFHDGKGIRQNLVQHLFDGLVLIFDQLVRLGGQLFLPAYGNVFFQFDADFGDAVFKRCFARTQFRLQFLRTGAQRVIR